MFTISRMLFALTMLNVIESPASADVLSAPDVTTPDKLITAEVATLGLNESLFDRIGNGNELIVQRGGGTIRFRENAHMPCVFEEIYEGKFVRAFDMRNVTLRHDFSTGGATSGWIVWRAINLLFVHGRPDGFESLFGISRRGDAADGWTIPSDHIAYHSDPARSIGAMTYLSEHFCPGIHFVRPTAVSPY